MLPSWIQVEKLEAAIRVLFRDGDDQAEVGLHELFFRVLGVGLAALDDLDRPAQTLGRLLQLVRP